MSYRTTEAAHPLIYVRNDLVTAIDRTTGKRIWTYSVSTRVIRILLAYDCIYLLDRDCVVHCLKQTGALMGMVPAGDPKSWGASMIAEDGRIYVATTVGVTALTPDGKRVWEWTTGHDSEFKAFPALALPGQTHQPDYVDRSG